MHPFLFLAVLLHQEAGGVSISGPTTMHKATLLVGELDDFPNSTIEDPYRDRKLTQRCFVAIKTSSARRDSNPHLPLTGGNALRHYTTGAGYRTQHPHLPDVAFDQEGKAKALAKAAEAGLSIRNARRNFANFKIKMTALRHPDRTVTSSRRTMEKVIHDF
ncbi:unnamed protein product [Heligmosomoides polygyrus]|uniref:Secreted protein n=1 Tax=Heligmosomoides polygyrus TaxID=6339 RepID=A0A183FPD9_HELPZ|nr:unnamed protein product [Heligmosomoides polygyrus]